MAVPEIIEQQEPAAAVDQLSRIAEPRTVVLDFDETIFLRNSTEHYLDSLRPQALGALLLIILEIIRPWDWLPKTIRGAESKDWVRVLTATVLFPWTLPLWRKRARKLAREHENRKLAQAVADNPKLRPIIATHGFSFIVKPLARHLSIKTDIVAGCRFLLGVFDRQKKKETILAKHLTPEELAAAAVVTDSQADLSLLEKVQTPIFVRWPDARYVTAMADAYIPLFYLECVKRPGQRYIRWAIVETQMAMLLLAYSWMSTMPLLHAMGMVALLFSFWSVYETGYHENDRVAETYENTPVLSATYHQYRHRMKTVQPWLFAVASGILGTVLIRLAGTIAWELPINFKPGPETFELGRTLKLTAAWTGALIGTRIFFALYNYVNMETRIWLFPILQALKYFVFLTVARASVAGLALLLSQIFADWIPYLVYRCGGRRELVNEDILRLFALLLLWIMAGLTLGFQATLFNWQAAVILVWVLYRGKAGLSRLIKNARWVWRET